jgi:hypothetical protein
MLPAVVWTRLTWLHGNATLCVQVMQLALQTHRRRRPAVQREYRRERGHRLEAAWPVVEIGITPRPHECAKMPLTMRSLGSWLLAGVAVGQWYPPRKCGAASKLYAQAYVQQTSSYRRREVAAIEMQSPGKLS